MPETMTIRSFEDRDLEPVLDVLRLALGETPLLQRTAAWFMWKHFESPFGPSLIVVAETDRRIVGVRAFMRWEMTTPEGDTLRCVRAVDTATHPEYLRRGVFRELTLEAVDRATSDGVDLVFNTPNPKSGAGYLNMGWVQVGRIGVLMRPTWRMARRGRAPAEDPTSMIASDGPVAALEVEDRPALGLRTPRTPEYLAWRFGGHPTATYRQIENGPSTAVVRLNHRSGRNELVLSDVYGPEPTNAIKATRRRSRAEYMICCFSRASPERRAAIRNGMVPIPGVTGFNLVAKPLTELPIDLSDLENWDLAISDLELL